MDNTLFIMGMMERIKQKSQKHETNSERVLRVESAQCLGESCIYFAGQECDSRLELVEVKGKWDKPGTLPYIQDTDCAVYSQICKGAILDTPIALQAVSPNGKADPNELAAYLEQAETRQIIFPPRG